MVGVKYSKIKDNMLYGSTAMLLSGRKKGRNPMHIITVSKRLFNPVRLPGMGRSIEINGLSDSEVVQIRQAFIQQHLAVEFEEEPGTQYPVIQLWANPHGGGQVTVFV